MHSHWSNSITWSFWREKSLCKPQFFFFYMVFLLCNFLGSAPVKSTSPAALVYFLGRSTHSFQSWNPAWEADVTIKFSTGPPLRWRNLAPRRSPCNIRLARDFLFETAVWRVCKAWLLVHLLFHQLFEVEWAFYSILSISHVLT
jgi:hypothetical protein